MSNMVNWGSITDGTDGTSHARSWQHVLNAHEHRLMRLMDADDASCWATLGDICLGTFSNDRNDRTST